MKYFVVADVHAFYTELKKALAEKDFDENNPNHKLIICGDLLDRGEEPLSTEAFAADMLEKNKAILIRGNHEDLLLDLLDNFEEYKSSLLYSHHWENGTLLTALKLAPARWLNNCDFTIRSKQFVSDVKNTRFVKDIIPHMLNYYETPHYIFTHGYIPCKVKEGDKADWYAYMPDWRNATADEWNKARWFNGQYIATVCGVTEPNKTIVCGHIGSNYGHVNFENQQNYNFTPYYGKGIIAIDALCEYSGQINCIVIED
ncbi:MAG: metallophosphoesterase [Clostridia bacterium]|nr:metallophosphoesterase [Clostridia bacterium]